jgi:hypothetical protein
MWLLTLALLAAPPYIRELPDLADLERFPPHELACPCVRFNRAYRDHLELSLGLELHHETWLTRAIEETDELYRAWDALADASKPGASQSWRRRRLADLREVLGPERYAAGEMPPCVPLWRFRDVR